MKKEKLSKYLKGTAKALKQIPKEIDKVGIDNKSLNLMKKIGSDLLYKGVAIGY